MPYIGRIAPTPTGHLHLGHARTFQTAWRRAREAGGHVLLRIDDLDGPRCKPEFTEAAIEDLSWLGIEWRGAPVWQSRRTGSYRATLRRLHAGGHLFACHCSRRDIAHAARAPHAADDETLYPGTCRELTAPLPPPSPVTWRFRVPDGETVSFTDQRHGEVHYIAGRDFGDFPVWRKDDIPSYQLACVVDDHEMGVTEVVRGDDLLVSTARQILLYRALGWHPPGFLHTPLMTDQHGNRLAKRHQSLSLQTLRAQGVSPESIRQKIGSP